MSAIVVRDSSFSCVSTEQILQIIRHAAIDYLLHDAKTQKCLNAFARYVAWRLSFLPGDWICLVGPNPGLDYAGPADALLSCVHTRLHLTFIVVRQPGIVQKGRNATKGEQTIMEQILEAMVEEWLHVENRSACSSLSQWVCTKLSAFFGPHWWVASVGHMAQVPFAVCPTQKEMVWSGCWKADVNGTHWRLVVFCDITQHIIPIRGAWSLLTKQVCPTSPPTKNQAIVLTLDIHGMEHEILVQCVEQTDIAAEEAVTNGKDSAENVGVHMPDQKGLVEVNAAFHKAQHHSAANTCIVPPVATQMPEQLVAKKVANPCLDDYVQTQTAKTDKFENRQYHQATLDTVNDGSLTALMAMLYEVAYDKVINKDSKDNKDNVDVDITVWKKLATCSPTEAADSLRKILQAEFDEFAAQVIEAAPRIEVSRREISRRRISPTTIEKTYEIMKKPDTSTIQLQLDLKRTTLEKQLQNGIIKLSSDLEQKMHQPATSNIGQAEEQFNGELQTSLPVVDRSDKAKPDETAFLLKVAGLIPAVETAIDLNSAADNFKRGDYVSAFIDLGMSGLSVAPVLDPAAKIATRVGRQCLHLAVRNIGGINTGALMELHLAANVNKISRTERTVAATTENCHEAALEATVEQDIRAFKNNIQELPDNLFEQMTVQLSQSAKDMKVVASNEGIKRLDDLKACYGSGNWEKLQFPLKNNEGETKAVVHCYREKIRGIHVEFKVKRDFNPNLAVSAGANLLDQKLQYLVQAVAALNIGEFHAVAGALIIRPRVLAGSCSYTDPDRLTQQVCGHELSTIEPDALALPLACPSHHPVNDLTTGIALDGGLQKMEVRYAEATDMAAEEAKAETDYLTPTKVPTSSLEKEKLEAGREKGKNPFGSGFSLRELITIDVSSNNVNMQTYEGQKQVRDWWVSQINTPLSSDLKNEQNKLSQQYRQSSNIPFSTFVSAPKPGGVDLREPVKVLTAKGSFATVTTVCVVGYSNIVEVGTSLGIYRYQPKLLTRNEVLTIEAAVRKTTKGSLMFSMEGAYVVDGVINRMPGAKKVATTIQDADVLLASLTYGLDHVTMTKTKSPVVTYTNPLEERLRLLRAITSSRPDKDATNAYNAVYSRFMSVRPWPTFQTHKLACICVDDDGLSLVVKHQVLVIDVRGLYKDWLGESYFDDSAASCIEQRPFLDDFVKNYRLYINAYPVLARLEEYAIIVGLFLADRRQFGPTEETYQVKEPPNTPNYGSDINELFRSIRKLNDELIGKESSHKIQIYKLLHTAKVWLENDEFLKAINNTRLALWYIQQDEEDLPFVLKQALAADGLLTLAVALGIERNSQNAATMAISISDSMLDDLEENLFEGTSSTRQSLTKNQKILACAVRALELSVQLSIAAQHWTQVAQGAQAFVKYFSNLLDIEFLLARLRLDSFATLKQCVTLQWLIWQKNESAKLRIELCSFTVNQESELECSDVEVISRIGDMGGRDPRLCSTANYLLLCGFAHYALATHYSKKILNESDIAKALASAWCSVCYFCAAGKANATLECNSLAAASADKLSDCALKLKVYDEVNEMMLKIRDAENMLNSLNKQTQNNTLKTVLKALHDARQTAVRFGIKDSIAKTAALITKAYQLNGDKEKEGIWRRTLSLNKRY